MLKLDTPITIGDFTYTHMIFVKGEFDLRVPYAELHPALVRVTGESVLIGRWRLTDAGVQPEYSELLTAIRLQPQTDAEGNSSPEQEAFIAGMRTQFLQYLEGLEQIAVGLQADPIKNRLTGLKLALSTFSLACTFEPLGDRGIGVDVVNERTLPMPEAQPVEEVPS